MKPASGATIEVSGSSGGTVFQASGGTAIPNGSTFLFTSPVGGFVSGGLFDNVEVINPASVPGESNQHTISSTVNGTLTVTDGQVGIYGTNNNIVVGADGIFKPLDSCIIKGSITNTSGGTASAPTSSFITLGGSGAQHLAGPISLYAVTINNTAAAPGDSSAVTTSGQLSVDYFANVLDGQFSPTTGDTFNALLVGPSGILKPASGATILVTGTLGSDIVSVQTGGTFTANSSTFHITTPTPSFLSGAAFYNLYVASTAAVPGDSNMISLSSNAQVTNLLTLASGQLRPFGTVNDVVVEAGAILKPNGNLTISGDLVSSGTLTSNATTDRYIFNSGTLQNFTSYKPATLPRITIGAGTVLNENGAADSTSTQITNNGTLRRTRTATVGTVTGGLTGATLDVVALGTLGTVVIDRIASVPNAGPGHDTTASWTFDVAGATGYSVGLTLPHSNATPGNAAVARYLGTGTSWQYAQSSFTATTVTLNGITSLSSVWAVADFTQTSVPDWTTLND